jgi:glutathione S-transferase
MHVIEEWADEVLYFYGIYGVVKLGGATTIPYLANPLPPDMEGWAETAVRSWLEELLQHQGMGRYPADKIEADLARSLDALDALVTRHGFAAGSVLTLADLALWGQMQRYFLSGTQPRYEREVRARKSLIDWFERVDAAARGVR